MILGIGGLEHLSNSLNTRQNNITASPQILAQMRSEPHRGLHGSLPESTLIDQLNQLNLGVEYSDKIAQSPAVRESSHSRVNSNSMPDLEYDPWRAN